MFSFNSPFGACPTCDGLGQRLTVDLDLVVPDPNKTLNEGAIEPWEPTSLILPNFIKTRMRSI